jgi:hypothetical protein
LPVHPRCDEPADLLRRFGPDAVWLEFADGSVTIVPKTWTSLVPRSSPLVVGKQLVRLAPAAAAALAAWIAARRESLCGKLDTSIEAGDTAAEHGRRRRRSGSNAEPAAVVEQARAPSRRRARGRARGQR